MLHTVTRTSIDMPSLRLLMLAALLSMGLDSAAVADDWPQWLGPHRDGVWHEDGIVDSIPEGGLPVRWRVPVKGGYSGPAVADGRVYVGIEDGFLVSAPATKTLDKKQVKEIDFAVPIAFMSFFAPALRTAAHVAAALAAIILAISLQWVPNNLWILLAGAGGMIVGAEVERRMAK